jgi:hypothetical protein
VVDREELLLVLLSFQNDKSLGPDGMVMEFYLGLFYHIEEDLRRVTNE